ncbi:DUF6325 family protein [Herbiconiux sp. UC225_62]|uniref:DUF6325 family protein n=1 Tax=Herbiconiux sp. UC225_62 TaxID=3350168 RepID=UPI0036D300E4
MTDFEYGPVEIYLIGFAGERPGADVVDAIRDLVRTETVNLLDLLFVSRSDSGDLTVLEIEEVADDYGVSDLDVAEMGLAGDEDVEDLAESLPPGSSAAILVVEHAWAREFAQALDRAGGLVLGSERIPAPVVNELVTATRA